MAKKIAGAKEAESPTAEEFAAEDYQEPGAPPDFEEPEIPSSLGKEDASGGEESEEEEFQYPEGTSPSGKPWNEVEKELARKTKELEETKREQATWLRAMAERSVQTQTVPEPQQPAGISDEDWDREYQAALDNGNNAQAARLIRERQDRQLVGLATYQQQTLQAQRAQDHFQGVLREIETAISQDERLAQYRDEMLREVNFMGTNNPQIVNMPVQQVAGRALNIIRGAHYQELAKEERQEGRREGAKRSRIKGEAVTSATMKLSSGRTVQVSSDMRRAAERMAAKFREAEPGSKVTAESVLQRILSNKGQSAWDEG